MTEQTPVVGMS